MSSTVSRIRARSSSRFSAAVVVIATLATWVGLCPRSAGADPGGLAVFVGDWDLRVRVLQPEPKELRYREHYDWVLNRHFIRGEAGPKPDGTRDHIYGTYDEENGGYPFWVFSSSGTYLYLPPGTWDAKRRVMEWENPAGLDINYRSHCAFPGADKRQCHLIIKDWKGRVMQEMEWTAVRRAN
ncbi:MAG: DUF1579 family protein [Gammaproteobacteria bacterium]|nr:DUF1579 family protein [Gammaproteobacteria bacterium]